MALGVESRWQNREPIPAGEGIRKDVAAAGFRSMKGASDRESRSFFTKEREHRSWPVLPKAKAWAIEDPQGSSNGCRARESAFEARNG